MSKLSRHLDLALAPRAPGQPLHRWLYAELRRAIVEGRLRPGARLPSSRNLAQQQAVARTTVVSIFEQLRIEGDLTSRTGSGTVVAAQLSDQFIQAGPPRRTGRVANAGDAARRPAAGLRPRGFQVCEPPADVFPLALWAQLTARRYRRGGTALLRPGEPRGDLPLREAIAAHLGAARSVHAEAARVVIVRGTQQALDLVTRLLVRPGEPVWMESPGYAGAVDAFRQAGARIVPVRVDADGLDVATAVRRRTSFRWVGHWRCCGVWRSWRRDARRVSCF